MRERFFHHVLAPAGFCLVLGSAVHGQAPAPGPRPGTPLMPSTAAAPMTPQAAAKPEASLDYILGPEDQISVSVLDLPDVPTGPYRLDEKGFIKLPGLPDRIQAAGLTAEQLEGAIAGALKTILKDPQVTVSIVVFHSQSLSVMGSVRTPGVVTLEGRKTLVDVLSAVGGLTDDAGYTIKIVRRLEYGRIPLPSAVDDASGQYSVAEVDAKSILDISDPAQNIIMYPGDEIAVPHGDMIYAIGNVNRIGGYVLQQRSSLTVLQTLSLAGGLVRGASAKHARILRVEAGKANLVEVPVDLTAILHGKAPDVGMHSGDILFVPSSKSATTALRAADVLVGMAGIAIYRIP
jgi:polysaccharide export outer membrane protein